jgi:zinc and cadmium transporter
MLAWAIVATIAAGVVAIAAGLVSFAIPTRYRSLLLSFAIGVLLGVAFLHLLPEAASTFPLRPLRDLLMTTLAAMVACHLAEDWHNVNRRSSGNAAIAQSSSSAGGLVLASDAVHNFTDGILIGFAFRVDPNLGVFVTIGIVAHEMPREMSTFAILTDLGWSRSRTLVWGAACRLPAIAAAALAYAALSSAPMVMPYVVAATAGVLLYIAVADLMPALRAKPEIDRGARAGCLLLGALIVAAATYSSR